MNRLMTWGCAVMLCFGAAAGETQAAEMPPKVPVDATWVSLGPYVQFEGPDRATVRWETSFPCSTMVEYGPTRALGRRVVRSEATTSHEVVIDGLKWKTKHWYRIGSQQGQNERVSELFWFDNAINYTVLDVAAAGGDFPASRAAPDYAEMARQILAQGDIDRGYTLVYGLESSELLFELARQSKLIIHGIDADEQRVEAAAKALLDAGVYGVRVKVRRVEDLGRLPFTKDFFNLIVSVGEPGGGTSREMYRVLRPFGGTAVLLARADGEIEAMKRWLAAGSVEYTTGQAGLAGQWFKVVRGAVAGTNWWTHQYGGPHNAGNSFDNLSTVHGTGDMQMQWLGRPGLDAGLDRQVRMPAPVAANGRLYHQGWNRVMAMDSFNGTCLWTLEIPHLRRVNLPRDASNMCADDDAVYLAVKDACWRLDGQSGKRSMTYRLEEAGKDWGIVFRYGDLLYGSSTCQGAAFTEYWGEDHWYEGHPGLVWGGTHPDASRPVLSESLFAIDPQTGKRLWTYKGGMVINSAVAFNGQMMLFVESRTPEIQGQPSGKAGTLENSEQFWQDFHLVALDAKTGKKLWERDLAQATDGSPAVSPGIVVFYLLTATRGDETYLVLQASTPLKEGEPLFIAGAEDNGQFHLYGYRADRGGTEFLWSASNRWKWVVKKKMKRSVVVGDMVVMGHKGYRLSDGVVVVDDVPAYGCGTLAGIGNKLVGRFDDGGAGTTLYDIAMWDFSTKRLSAWTPLRPGCWISVVSGGGMLLAPEAGGGCSCQLYFGTSIGFAPAEK